MARSKPACARVPGPTLKPQLLQNPFRIKTVVLIPTYNESGTILPLISAIRTSLPGGDIVIVDDASPDGTGRLVSAIAARDSKVLLIERAGKFGLGTAYIEGFRRVLSEGYEIVISMDADFSHDPARLPTMVQQLENCDVVIGSRYVRGGSTPNWRIIRRFISRFGNWIARTTLGLPIRDCTSAFRCYRKEALTRVNFEQIKVVGYGFLIETIRQLSKAGVRISEMPITFIDRRVGKSKLSGGIVFEAFNYVVGHLMRSRRHSGKQRG